jgi:hypothetical protein
VRDAKSLGRLLRGPFGAIDAVRSTRSTIVLESLRESTQLPIALNVSTETSALVEELEEVSLE